MLEVTIIGAGITGASTAFHLQKLGITNISVISRRDPAARDLSAARAPCLGGMADNITRLETARGGEVAASVWRFGNAAFDQLASYCRNSGVNFFEGQHVRAATAPMEAREVGMAVDSLRRMGFQCTHGMVSEWAPDARPDVPTQVESGKSAAVDADQLLRSLGSDVTVGEVSRIEANHSGATVWVGHRAIKCQFVVLAAHQHISTILPSTQEWLVPYADQAHDVRGTFDPTAFKIGSTLTWNFGYNSLTRLDESLYSLRGARFLRRDGGIGQATATLNTPSLAKLLTDVERFFPGLLEQVPQASFPFVEIRPCDELPLIGPIPGAERISLATGFMGQGIPLGFLAGKCLADIIVKGKSVELPEILLPRRLRTMDGT